MPRSTSKDKNITPRISIGIPVYNQASTIRETLESVLSQSTPAFEIVVSENHSTDGTAEIVREYKNRIRIVTPPNHLPMADNWNFTVAQCNGEWVGLCSGDDLLLSNYVTDISKTITSYPQAVFFMGGWEFYDEITRQRTEHLLLSMKKVTCPPQTVAMNLAGPKASFAAFCFSKEAFDKVGGYNTSYQLYQDWVLQYDLGFEGDFVRIDSIIARYRVSQRPELEKRRRVPQIQDNLRYINTNWDRSLSLGIPLDKVREAGKQVLRRCFRDISEEKLDLPIQTEAILQEAVERVGLVDEFRLVQQGLWKPSEPSRIRASLRKIYRNGMTFLRRIH